MLLSEADAAQDGFLHKLNKQTNKASFIPFIGGSYYNCWWCVLSGHSVLSMVCQQTLVRNFVETLVF